MKSIFASCAIVILTLTVQRLMAIPITITAQVYATGALGTSGFSNALVTFIIRGDTTNVYNMVGNPQYPTLSNETTSISVAGVGTAVITDPLLVFDNQSLPGFIIDAAYSLGGGGVLILQDAAFGSYNFKEPLGPFIPSAASQNMDSESSGYGEPPYSINTTLGSLQFSPIEGSPGFSPTELPPGTLIAKPAVTLAGAALPGRQFVLSGTGGITNGTFTVLASTNFLLPLANWTPVLTNTFDGNGNFRYTNSIGLAPGRIFIIKE